jgi:CheY-like chemotaxis protein
MKTAEKNVLLVEDDIAISSAIKEWLEENGFRVHWASNGLEALKAVDNNFLPNLILLDLMMPIMDGFEFSEKRAKHPAIKDTPLVVMSADGHVVTKKVKTGAHDYLKKPLDIFKLLETVKKYVPAD